MRPSPKTRRETTSASSSSVPASPSQRVARKGDRTQLSGVTVLCIDNDLAILDGLETGETVATDGAVFLSNKLLLGEAE